MYLQMNFSLRCAPSLAATLGLQKTHLANRQVKIKHGGFHFQMTRGFYVE